MASMSMTTSFLGSANVSHRPWSNRNHGRVVMAKAAKVQCQDIDDVNRVSSTKRDLIFAAVAAAICTVASDRGIAAIAAEDPKPGTPEAKKIYAPICVTMPTARICHK